MIYKFLLFALILITNTLIAQEKIDAIEALEHTYHQHIPLIQDIAMGGFFKDTPLNIKGHSRYLNTIFEKGEVTINGISYKNVALSYDIHVDELITFHPLYSTKISLQPGKVNSFVLANGSKFIYKAEAINSSSFKNGYFHVLWDQDVQILAKHSKVIKKDSDEVNFPYKFIAESKYFLDINGQFLSIKRGNHLLKLLGIDKREIRRQLRDNYINYQKDPISYFQFVGQYYSQKNR